MTTDFSPPADDILTRAVDSDIRVQDGDLAENKTWPPRQFTERDERLRVLDCLWRGDFSPIPTWQPGPSPVPINLFFSYSTQVANILTSEPPSVAGLDEMFNRRLEETAYDALVDQSRFGGAVLLATERSISAVLP